jgi:hypothetical protein
MLNSYFLQTDPCRAVRTCEGDECDSLAVYVVVIGPKPGRLGKYTICASLCHSCYTTLGAGVWEVLCPKHQAELAAIELANED